MIDEKVSVRYLVGDVDEAVDFYTGRFGFQPGHDASPAFAEVIRGNLRLLLAGPESSAGRPLPDGRRPGPGGWNRIHFVVDDIAAEVERLRPAGGQLPQRDRQRTRRPADRARRSVRESDRAVPTGGLNPARPSRERARLARVVEPGGPWATFYERAED